MVLLDAPRTLATVSLSGRYGFTPEVLGERDTHHRAAGRLALAVHPVDALSVGLYMDGRWDRHSASSGFDSAVVSDPGVYFLFRVLQAGLLRLGVGTELWAPGRDRPGLVLRGLSPSLSLYGQLALPDVELTVRLGYLHDRTRHTIPNGHVYTPGDEVSLGVTNADAVLAGVGMVAHVGPIDLSSELSVDMLVRRGELPLNASRAQLYIGAMGTIGDRFRIGAEATLFLGSYPVITTTTRYRVEPRVSLSLVLVAELGRLSERVPGRDEASGRTNQGASLRGRATDDSGAPLPGALVRVERVQADAAGQAPAQAVAGEDGGFVIAGLLPGAYDVIIVAGGHREVRTQLTVEPDQIVEQTFVVVRERALSGRVASPSGQPLDAHVQILAGDILVAETTTDALGDYSLAGLPPGALTLVIESDGRLPVRLELDATARGSMAQMVLEEELPDGEIRGSILGTQGAPVPAQLLFRPGDLRVAADAEGRFSLVVAPGEYTVHIEAVGYRPQDRHVTVEQQGVVVLEVHLRPD